MRIWIPLALIAVGLLTAILVLRQESLLDSVTTLRGDLMPQEITLSPESVVTMNQQQTQSVTLKKEIEGVTVEYPCARLPEETAKQWGKRCATEFKEFCEGFEEEEEGDGA